MAPGVQGAVPVLSSVASSPTVADATPTEQAAPAGKGEQAPTTLASIAQQLADDDDPYAGL